MGDGPVLMQLLLVGGWTPISRVLPGNSAALYLICKLTGFNSKAETQGITGYYAQVQRATKKWRVGT